jgi:hypothetical protein
MKKKLIITESQYKRLINEQDDYTEQLLLLINSNSEDNLLMVKEIAPGQGINLVQFLSDNIEQIEPPYLYKFNLLDLSEEEQLEILKYLFGDGIRIIGKNIFNSKIGKDFYNPNGKQIYFEGNRGFWNKREYDSNGNQIYFEDSEGEWRKSEYDSYGNIIYYETSKGKIMDKR